ncbi:MAG: DUF4422 domain-containing protein [Bacteroidaceae bacterium]|nr:DUF4422 domain-containing protein [Bacteroidaceae bacterium]
MKNIKIIVAHHKESLLLDNDIYLPIHVGKVNSQIELGIHGDNEGDNISAKNPIYCEMTAIYWAWKNLKADYIGLCHYRRYFTFSKKNIFDRFKDNTKFYLTRWIGNILKPGINCYNYGQITTADINYFRNNALEFANQIDILLNRKEYDAIIPEPFYQACRNVRQFFERLGHRHISLICKIVSDINPDFYPYLKKALDSDKLYAANMFIMKTHLFEDYCEIIFPILQEHEKRTIEQEWCNDLIKEKAYSRLSGYFAEFLTSAYVFKLKEENKKIMYVNTMFCNSL